MEIYIVRHAIAEDSPRTGSGDALRALTPEGKKKMKEAAKGFVVLEPEIEKVFTSPLVRARQTAEILTAALEKKELDEMEELAPGHSPADVCARLKKLENAKNVMLVGHEPNCSELASYLLVGSRQLDMEFKKGGICLIQSGSCEPGSGMLIWHLSPQALRLMGR